MSASHWNRRIHRWGAVVTAIPLAVVIVSGLFLQLKKESDWVQPPTQKGSTQEPHGSLEDILSAARQAEHAGIKDWSDIGRLDVRPDKGMVKVRAKNGWEVQVDLANGAILQEAFRRSDLIESLHDGSFFAAKLTVFLPCAMIFLILWGTGLYLFFLPYLVRRRRRRRMRS